MIELTNKEREFIELALDEKWQFDWVSLEIKTLKKLYKTYANYMKMAFEKDDLEIKIDKVIKKLKLSNPAHWSNEDEIELLEILERGETNESN